MAMKDKVNWYKTKAGDVYLIKENGWANNLYEKQNLLFTTPKATEEFTWFATLQEAEEFSKELLKPKKEVKDEVGMESKKEVSFIE